MASSLIEAPAYTSSRLERFLFAPIDSRPAAAMRIALALVIPPAFWSHRLQWVPVENPLLAAIFDHAFFATYGYAALICILALLMGVGVYPRAMGLALVMLLIPLDQMTRGIQSRQVLLGALLAFSMVRSDACWSLITWLGKKPRRNCAGPIWPIRLMQIQLSLVYGVNVIAKARPAYLSGDVLIGMSRMRPNFLVHPAYGWIHLGPLALPPALAAIGTVLVEAYLAIGFWMPKLRWPTAVIGVAFHIMLQFIVRIFMLDLASMFLYSAFLLPWKYKAELK